MAEFKPIRTDSSHLNTTNIPIEDGKIIFVLDTNETYIDRINDDGQTIETIREKQGIGKTLVTNEIFNFIDGNNANIINETALGYVQGCHLEGGKNSITAAGNGYIHIEGYNNLDAGSGGGSNHLEGSNNINYSNSGCHHIEGSSNTNYMNGPANHIEGHDNRAYG